MEKYIKLFATSLLTFVLSLSVPLSAQTRTYKVGDYYPDPDVNLSEPSEVSKVEGIVFEVNADGTHGKIFSLKEGSGLKWSTVGGADYTDDEDNGMANLDILQVLEPDFETYPAFIWCAALGEGWYIPAINELVVLREAWGRTSAKKKELNRKIKAAGGDALSNAFYVKAKDADVSAYYVSSTENPEKRNKIFCLSFNSYSQATDAVKKLSDSAENLRFRAVKTF